MWKNYLNFTQKERRAILLVICLIMTGIGVQIYFFGPKENSEKEIAEYQAFQNEIKAYEASRKKTAKHGNYTRSKYTRFQPATYAPFDFDPNTADSLTFIHLGLKPFMARMILKYRSKGGKYRKPEDFAKVPYLDKALYAKLLPHIKINPRWIVSRRDTNIRYKPTVYQKQVKLVEGAHLDLNSADTTELKKVPGIGSGIAHAIVNYRNRLGGFYTITQLREMKQLTSDQIEKFSKFLAIASSSPIRKIPVNKSGIERLMSHPYLNFYQAKAIVELRKKKGKLTGLDQLSLYEEFTKQDCERLTYYLDFSQ